MTVDQRTIFASALGDVQHAEVQVGDESEGFWIIWDLDGRVLGSIQDHGRQGWAHASLPVGTPQGSFISFEDALADRLGLIMSSGGVQTDDLYWQGAGLPRLHGSTQG